MSDVNGRKFAFAIKGRSALLMHADNIDHADALQAWRQDPKNKGMSKAGDDRTPAWTWMGTMYSDGEHIALPTDNLAVAVRQAGAKLTLKGKKTFKEESVSGILFPDEFLKLKVNGQFVAMADLMDLREETSFDVHRKTAAKLGFSLFVKRAAVGTSKHIRVRPRFDDWSCEGEILVSSPAITADIVANLFELAGNVGVGSWRPGGKTPGRFGMFQSSIKQVK
jgi:hypothetical protein